MAPRLRRRVLSGSASLRSASTRTAYGPFPPTGAVGDGRPRRPTSMLFIRAAHPSPDGGSQRSRRCLFRLGFAPCLIGGQDWPVRLSGGREYAAFRVRPPPPRRGTERERREGYAVLALRTTMAACRPAGRGLPDRGSAVPALLAPSCCRLPAAFLIGTLDLPPGR